ncbi:hypothetical protein JTE90_008127 [Oedothorax gibbosus]|uniref:Uncharacterized protein n=1 Tax=Oedothorax gibbosus TaxID=931172 RepID=A0AAV6TX23_9ARAC|nr:hypothetical protein JTE90_008127 [Oedothorax gibbosus]
MAPRINIFLLLISAAYCGSLADGHILLELTPGECYEMVRLATAGDQVDMVELLASHGCSVNRPPGSTSRQSTPLHIAAVSGYLDMVDKLLDYGADVHARARPSKELFKKKCATCKYLLKHD